MKRIAYGKAALKTLSRMPTNVSAMIRSKLTQYAADPAAQAHNVTRPKNMASACRLRVGDWRVLFTEDGEIVAIIKVTPRGSAHD
ncbi:type II toxin-antitoxin system RelE/ParE family toxin [Methylobacterium sp. WL30]|uniref:type II toxin-antitoxin system RelE family toxin n=1 Tax=unclassified Methylobacterium TaxID=2615210 RepID=UPI0011C6F210|nr:MULTISPECIES: type II toxin-antitoxin system RelE/ParE family toxin [unclassified Methylobacterium]TXN34175.1 type II toxin-antitoxin system RelE/ParE family toxin [Methylobacterium sp. WL93]TXN44221.1 type II toxin-antitoxin system RelE/ParE family toxin [Methylobacterium sp. WL119]TXN66798.1 type II toxin-antitoxin system RelE/ParE family toxin [Methylobacterium sp. WL30]